MILRFNLNVTPNATAKPRPGIRFPLIVDDQDDDTYYCTLVEFETLMHCLRFIRGSDDLDSLTKALEAARTLCAVIEKTNDDERARTIHAGVTKVNEGDDYPF